MELFINDAERIINIECEGRKYSLWYIWSESFTAGMWWWKKKHPAGFYDGSSYYSEETILKDGTRLVENKICYEKPYVKINFDGGRDGRYSHTRYFDNDEDAKAFALECANIGIEKQIIIDYK